MRMIFRLCVITLGVLLLPGLLCVIVLIHCAVAIPETVSSPADDELSAYAEANSNRPILSNTNSPTQSVQPPKCE